MQTKELELGLVVAEDLDFGFEFEVALLVGGLLDGRDELENFGGGGAALVDDEIAMHVGHRGVTDGGAFEAEDPFSLASAKLVLEAERF